MKNFINSTAYLVIMLIAGMCWFLYGIPLVIAVIMLIVRIRAEKKSRTEQEALNQQLNEAQKELAAPAYKTYMEVQGNVDQLNSEVERLQQLVPEMKECIDIKELIGTKKSQLEEQNQVVEENQKVIDQLVQSIRENNEQLERLNKQVHTQTTKLGKSRELYKSMQYAIENFAQTGILMDSADNATLDEYAPGIMLQLHCMENKDLRKAFRDNDKQISKVLEMYAARYTTKANKAIYQLMVIALRAELQNVLYNLKYEKLDKSIDDIKAITEKYLKIAGEGNQSIAGTLTKFIGEIEYLFINAAKIEYNYYVKKEQVRQEQAALKEQMRQEAEERKALLEEQKKIEKEEKKYQAEIAKLQEQSETAGEEEKTQIQTRILELESQLSDVIVKKDEIVKLQNGKAGTVYVISNLGSFGENVFKVGMTRRTEPLDRIKELSNASVPFQFDVHSFIFSDDAVDLEHRMHEILNEKRVNKVNLRKEFFQVSLDELEAIVYEIDPTANFNRTMLAEEYRQSISSEYNYTSDYEGEDDDSDEE